MFCRRRLFFESFCCFSGENCAAIPLRAELVFADWPSLRPISRRSVAFLTELSARCFVTFFCDTQQVEHRSCMRGGHLCLGQITPRQALKLTIRMAAIPATDVSLLQVEKSSIDRQNGRNHGGTTDISVLSCKNIKIRAVSRTPRPWALQYVRRRGCAQVSPRYHASGVKYPAHTHMPPCWVSEVRDPALFERTQQDIKKDTKKNACPRNKNMESTGSNESNQDRDAHLSADAKSTTKPSNAVNIEPPLYRRLI